MLFLSINLGGMLFAVPSRDVIRVLPLLELRTMPGTPAFLAGVFEYEDRLVPVVDLQILTHQQASARRFSTRILLAKPAFEDFCVREIGVLAERVTDAIDIDTACARAPGVQGRGMEFLGGIVEAHGRTYQIVHLERILNKPMKEVLARDFRSA